MAEGPGVGEAGEGDPLRRGQRQELLDDVEAALELGVVEVADPSLGALASTNLHLFLDPVGSLLASLWNID